jgi:ketosteroid isomerase-like protein
MPDEHPNFAPVRALFEAFEKRDASAIAGAIPEDAVWRFPASEGHWPESTAGDRRS